MAHTELIDNTLQAVVQIQNEKKELAAHNEELMAKLSKALEGRGASAGIQDNYMQGAAWMGSRLMAEIESLCENMTFLTNEFNQRIQDQL